MIKQYLNGDQCCRHPASLGHHDIIRPHRRTGIHYLKPNARIFERRVMLLPLICMGASPLDNSVSITVGVALDAEAVPMIQHQGRHRNSLLNSQYHACDSRWGTAEVEVRTFPLLRVH